jgi:hypothetical protein
MWEWEWGRGGILSKKKKGDKAGGCGQNGMRAGLGEPDVAVYPARRGNPNLRGGRHSLSHGLSFLAADASR